ncbi:activator of 90 kDa heat shock protein ATPase homolog 2 isoform X2 [Fukomys damarensis]|uniref:activator of 90 kDa heat shock protein ATPase homolog 2 isoform X2 n=1 Tax=Fukomys damarensis TaxID=885580 RepID=UPI00053F9F23|nr:activator of 90 kDa heat shock protein ATPase homolog 2 isoform X2 [Fukomys damarensis]
MMFTSHPQSIKGMLCTSRAGAPEGIRTERDATNWSKGKLRELLVGIVVESEAGRCETSALKQVDGEASCSNRKGKLIFFYEWNIKLGWKGTVKECGAKHKGLIEIPDLSEENEVDDTEVNVSKKKGDGEILKDLMKTAGTAKVREALGDYLKALKTEFTMGMILPTEALTNQELTVKRKLSENTLQASSPVALGVKIPTVALPMTELFDTTVEQLYSIFTVKDLVQKFSKSSAVLEAEKGGKFQMFDGTITGEYIELSINRKIVMKWRYKNWPEVFLRCTVVSQALARCIQKYVGVWAGWLCCYIPSLPSLVDPVTALNSVMKTKQSMGILLNKAPFIYCQATAKEDSLQNQISCGCSIYK